MNIAIIGSNGFIGRHLTRKLATAGAHKIFLFGRSNTSIFNTEFPYSIIDLRDTENLRYHFAKIDLVYYLASESIPASSWERPVVDIENNLIPFLNFTETIAKLQVKKLCFISSAGTIYGVSTKKVAEDAEKNPFSPYGITKLAMEHYLNYFRKRFNLQSDVFRVSNVYGPGQDTSKGLGIINTFLEKIITEGSIHIFGNGENTRNYIYVKDVVELLALSATSGLDKSGTYNVSSDDTLTINELVEKMRKVVPHNFEVIYRDTRDSDNPAVTLDNTRIKKAVPSFRFTSIEDGIRATYLHIKEQVTR